MAQETRVTGLRELNEFLQQLPPKIEQNILRQALRAGAKVIEAQAKANAPVARPTAESKKFYGGYPGALRDSIRVGTRARGGTVTATIKAGGKRRGAADVFYAHMVEFGTRAHLITIGGSGKLAASINRARVAFRSIGSLVIGNKFVGPSVRHPGARKRPFMRPALDQQANAAVVAAAEYIKKRLATREGLDTSHVMIEGDE